LSCHGCKSLITGGRYQFTSKEVNHKGLAITGNYLGASWDIINCKMMKKIRSGNISLPSLWHTVVMLLITATNAVKAGLSNTE